MRFHPESVYFLVALVLLPLVWWRWARREPVTAARFSSTAFLRAQRPGLTVRLRWIVPLLRTLTIATLIVCLARPEKGNEQTRIYAEGIAIQMVVDLSGSMEQADFVIDRRRVRRIDAVKRVFKEFVIGNGDELQGREDDLIGLIGFARYADCLAPLTLDHENVVQILDDLQTVAGEKVQQRKQALQQAYGEANRKGDRRRMQQIKAEFDALDEENRTAIGDGLGLAIERMRDLERGKGSVDAAQAARQNHRITSRVIILLSDGENNAGELTPEQAGLLAKASDIKVYTIGVGSTGQGGAVIDEPQMTRLAEETGGQYFRATDTGSLEEVYAKIDKLEKTKTEQRRYMQYKQWATSWITLGSYDLPPLLAVALVLVALEVLLSNTWFRKLP